MKKIIVMALVGVSLIATLTACAKKNCEVCGTEIYKGSEGKDSNRCSVEVGDEKVWLCETCATAFEALEQAGVKVDNAKELVDALKK